MICEGQGSYWRLYILGSQCGHRESWAPCEPALNMSVVYLQTSRIMEAVPIAVACGTCRPSIRLCLALSAHAVIPEQD